MEDSFGVNECERVWTCVVELASAFSSTEGAEIEIDTEGTVALRGGDDKEVDVGEVSLMLGNGWRPCTLGGKVGLDGVVALALLSFRLRYSATLSWNEVLIGENLGGDILLRSSADLDHPLREILRRSPEPC